MDKNLQDTTGRKFVIVTHIYAGARNKHNTKNASNNLWFTADATKYLGIMKKYNSKIVLEIGGHDHW